MMPTLTWLGALGLSIACRSGIIAFFRRSTCAGSTVFCDVAGGVAEGAGRGGSGGPPVGAVAGSRAQPPRPPPPPTPPPRPHPAVIPAPREPARVGGRPAS